MSDIQVGKPFNCQVCEATVPVRTSPRQILCEECCRERQRLKAKYYRKRKTGADADELKEMAAEYERYKKPKTKKTTKHKKDNQCSICLNSIKQPLTITDCKHVFCKDCFFDWYDMRTRTGLEPTCAKCRSEITEAYTSTRTWVLKRKTVEPPPPALIDTSEDSYPIDAILLHDYEAQPYLLYVKYTGYPTSEGQWRPLPELAHSASELTQAYLANHPVPEAQATG